jgi:hypothetical protein
VNDAIQSLIKSRRFWAVVLAMLVPIINKKFNLELSSEELLALFFGPVGWAALETIRSSQATNDPNTPTT